MTAHLNLGQGRACSVPRLSPESCDMAAPPSLSELIADGRWLAHRYDESSDEVQFRFVPRESQRTMTFLTDSAIGDAPIAQYRRADCLAAAQNLASPAPRIIFHSAYCCSTLLARAFDIPGVSFGLKEPQILNDVVGLQLRRHDPRRVAAAADVSLALLARPLGAGEVNVIKPSNLINPLIPLVTALRPHIRGLLLHAPLEVFLASIARKEVEGRAWVRDLMWKFIRLGQAERFGLSDEDLYRQTDLQAGAVAWLGQQAIFAEAAQQHPGFRTLDSEMLIDRPLDCLEALVELFALELDSHAIVRGPAFRTHSKDRSDYSAEKRREDSERGRDLHAREIAIVMQWAEQLAAHSGIAMTLPSPLID
jgi:hypothetical protein